MRPLNELPGDYPDITNEFLKSRFWLELLKPELEAEMEWADSHAANSTDPWIRYGTVDYGKAFHNIREWLKLWAIYPERRTEEENEDEIGAPTY